MKNVTVYTDGACSGNPGPGGWGAVLIYGAHRREISGGNPATTNNRMEILAVIEGLKLLKEPCAVTLFSDSRYVVDAVEKGWAVRWQKQGWMRNKKEPALNADLWEELLPLLKIHDVKFQWVKGHAGHPENERCDQLARAAISQGSSEPEIRTPSPPEGRCDGVAVGAEAGSARCSEGDWGRSPH